MLEILNTGRRLFDVNTVPGLLTLLTLPVIAITLLVAAFINGTGFTGPLTSQEDVAQRVERFIQERVRTVDKDYLFGMREFRDGVSEARMTVRVVRDRARLHEPWGLALWISVITFFTVIFSICGIVNLLIRALGEHSKNIISSTLNINLISTIIRLFSLLFTLSLMIISILSLQDMGLLSHIISLFSK
jgi:hypothetical protein